MMYTFILVSHKILIFFLKIVKDLMGYQNLRIILDFVFNLLSLCIFFQMNNALLYEFRFGLPTRNRVWSVDSYGYCYWYALGGNISFIALILKYKAWFVLFVNKYKNRQQFSSHETLWKLSCYKICNCFMWCIIHL
jgi:hypothetical protein